MAKEKKTLFFSFSQCMATVRKSMGKCENFPTRTSSAKIDCQIIKDVAICKSIYAAKLNELIAVFGILCFLFDNRRQKGQ